MVSICPRDEELLKRKSGVGVSNVIRSDGVSEFGNQEEVGVSTSGLQECPMARPRACRDSYGCYGCKKTGFRVNLKDPYEICAEIRDRDVGICGVENSFVGMRSLLAIWVGTRLGERERECLDGIESAVGIDGVTGYRRATTNTATCKSVSIKATVITLTSGQLRFPSHRCRRLCLRHRQSSDVGRLR